MDGVLNKHLRHSWSDHNPQMQHSPEIVKKDRLATNFGLGYTFYGEDVRI